MLGCISAGIVESSSRRMGNRSKTLLKKGQSLGERAILEGEPAGESCTASSPVLALIVNRQACCTSQNFHAACKLQVSAEITYTTGFDCVSDVTAYSPACPDRPCPALFTLPYQRCPCCQQEVLPLAALHCFTSFAVL